MKKHLIKIFVSILAVMLAACLDDTKYAIDPSNTENIIEFYDNSVPSSPSGAVYPVWTATTEIVPDYTFEQTISYSGPNGNSKDIELTLEIDPSALDEYNTQMVDGLNGKPELGGGTYQLMPDTYYDFDDFTVTIPKGETKVNIQITAHPDLFDLTKNWALPLRIVSSSSGIISANWSVAILAVVVKNKYDGIYSIETGFVTRLVGGVQDATLGGNYKDELEMPLATINGNTVGIVPLWADGSGIGGISGTRITINETDNTVVFSSTGNPTMVNQGALNKYDPDELTFEGSFAWGNLVTRRIDGLKIRYDRPRP